MCTQMVRELGCNDTIPQVSSINWLTENLRDGFLLYLIMKFIAIKRDKRPANV